MKSLSPVLTGFLALVTLAVARAEDDTAERAKRLSAIASTMSDNIEFPETFEEAIGRYFISKYVKAREDALFFETEHNYWIVGLLSTARLHAEFDQLFRAKYQTDPGKLDGALATVKVRIRQIVFRSDKSAKVSYVREEKISERVERSYWAAEIGFTLISKRTSSNDDDESSIEFVVNKYQTFEEAS